MRGDRGSIWEVGLSLTCLTSRCYKDRKEKEDDPYGKEKVV